jgi:hypothetical protein
MLNRLAIRFFPFQNSNLTHISVLLSARSKYAPGRFSMIQEVTKDACGTDRMILVERMWLVLWHALVQPRRRLPSRGLVMLWHALVQFSSVEEGS